MSLRSTNERNLHVELSAGRYFVFDGSVAVTSRPTSQAADLVVAACRRYP